MDGGLIVINVTLCLIMGEMGNECVNDFRFNTETWAALLGSYKTHLDNNKRVTRTTTRIFDENSWMRIK